ncbi:MAG: PAC2 family protein [Nitrososphaerota archaeon]|nr:PAC2 family protein [Nitrososphaerota archaeon]
MAVETEAIFEPGYEDYRIPGAVLIEGLPGVGLVAKVAVAYLIDKLKSKKICRFYSPFFPSTCYIRGGRLIPYFADIYLAEEPRPLLLLYGNAQPASYYGQHEFCEKVLEVSLKLGANFIITLGGYGKEMVSRVRTIYLSSTSDEAIKSALRRLDAVPYEGQIIGAAGLLITMAGEYGVDNLSLLIETGEAAPDYHAARRAIEAIDRLLDLGIPVDDVYGISRVYGEAVEKFET